MPREKVSSPSVLSAAGDWRATGDRVSVGAADIKEIGYGGSDSSKLSG